MSFKKLFTEFVEFNNTSTQDDVLDEFKVSNIEELELLYTKDRGEFIKNLSNFFHCEKCIDLFLLNDREFLREYSPVVIDYIEYNIFRQKSSAYEERCNSYFAWKDKKFNYGDFSMEDISTIFKILEYPPYPLQKHYANEELFNEKSHILKKC